MHRWVACAEWSERSLRVRGEISGPLGMVPDADDGTAVAMQVEVPVDAPFAPAQYVSVLDSERGEEARACLGARECSRATSLNGGFVYFFWSAQTCRVAKQQVRCASPVLGAISLKDISSAGRCHEGRICRPELFVPTADERAYWTVIAAESYRLESNARVAAFLRDRIATQRCTCHNIAVASDKTSSPSPLTKVKTCRSLGLEHAARYRSNNY